MFESIPADFTANLADAITHTLVIVVQKALLVTLVHCLSSQIKDWMIRREYGDAANHIRPLAWGITACMVLFLDAPNGREYESKGSLYGYLTLNYTLAALVFGLNLDEQTSARNKQCAGFLFAINGLCLIYADFRVLQHIMSISRSWYIVFIRAWLGHLLYSTTYEKLSYWIIVWLIASIVYVTLPIIMHVGLNIPNCFTGFLLVYIAIGLYWIGHAIHAISRRTTRSEGSIQNLTKAFLEFAGASSIICLVCIWWLRQHGVYQPDVYILLVMVYYWVTCTMSFFV